MITFEEYKKSKGELDDQYIFSDLESKVCDLISAMIQKQIPFWNVKPNLEDYNLDLTKIITLQIDFVDKNGGSSVFDGHSDFNFKSASLSGMSYSMDNSSVNFFEGIPVHPVVATLLRAELVTAGLSFSAIC